MIISLLWILDLPNRFKEDKWPYCASSDSGGYTILNCHNLMGHGHVQNNPGNSTFIVYSEYKYQPDVGWWLMIPAIVFSLASMGVTLKSRRSIPKMK